MKHVVADLSRLKKAQDWRREDASTLFGTEASGSWFRRKHRAELIKNGALISRSGRAGDLVNVDRIGHVVSRILEEESRYKFNESSDF